VARQMEDHGGERRLNFLSLEQKHPSVL
jgi:hypothetical protein